MLLKFLLRKYDIIYSENTKYYVGDFPQQKSMILSFRKHQNGVTILETWYSEFSTLCKHNVMLVKIWNVIFWLWLWFWFYRSLNWNASLKKILWILEKMQVYPPKTCFLISANVYVIIVQIFQYLHNRNIKTITNISRERTCNYSNCKNHLHCI